MDGSRSFRWQDIQFVIFDVDGTIYSQRKMRYRMILEMARYFLGKPSMARARDLAIIYYYRLLRERTRKESEPAPLSLLYAIAAKRFGVSRAIAEQVVKEWIHQRPLKYLVECRFPDILDFVEVLKKKQVGVCVFSDYTAVDKLEALQFPAEYVCSAEDQGIEKQKPDPSGVRRILQSIKAHPHETLIIGDREETDGLCALRMGMPYLILNGRQKAKSFTSYRQLIQELEGVQ